MKQKLLLFFCICLLFFLLLHPAEALPAARDGLTLWLNVMIPALLPFLILTGILLKTGNIRKLLNPAAPLTKKLLGLSPAGTYVFLLGLLCGYPMGAKLAHDLYINQQISRREGEYLLSFSCNASPAFILSYLAGDCLKSRISGSRIMLLLLGADLICMLFFRFIVYHGHTVSSVKSTDEKKETSGQDSTEVILDVSIMNGFETITRLGGYILLFSLICACVSYYWPLSPLTGILFTVPVELTTGLHRIALSPLAWKKQYYLSMMLTAFGGLCIMAQTESVLENRLSLIPYVTSKCLNTAVILLLLVLSDII